MKIIAETTTLYSPKDGKKHGLTIIPSCTIIDGEVYRDFEDGELLYDMAFLMGHYDDEYYNKEDLAALFYDCIHKLIELAGSHGFHGNLWHCYLANLLVNNENSYSKSCEAAVKKIR